MVDGHVHFWRYVPADYPWIDASTPALRHDQLPPQLAATLAAQGVDAVIAIQARPSEVENQWLLDLAQQHTWIRAVIGWIDLEAEAAPDSMERWRAHERVRGFRPMLQDAADPAAVCAQATFKRNMRVLQDHGLLFELLLHADQLAFAPAFCVLHDRGTIIVDQLGKPGVDGSRDSASFTTWRRHLAALAALPHVSIKLSGLMSEVAAPLRRPETTPSALYEPYLDAALALFGPQRLVFGSDWPVCLGAWGYEAFLRILADWARTRLSAAERAQVMGLNAMRLYGIAGP